jgi:hypothetical protein
MSTTYASPTAIKYLLLIINSIIFSIGMMIALHGTILTIGVSTLPRPYAPKAEVAVADSRSSSSSSSTSEEVDTSHFRYQDRFPSVGSPSVLLIFGVLTMGTSSLGITAVHFDDPALLDTFGYVSFISCFIKFLFFFATTQMHAFHYDYNPFSRSAISALFVAVIEVVLGSCACHLAKVIKRGEPNREIPPFPRKEEDDGEDV